MSLIAPPPSAGTSSNSLSGEGGIHTVENPIIDTPGSEGAAAYDWDDEEGWQDMPVVRSDDLGSSSDLSSDDDDGDNVTIAGGRGAVDGKRDGGPGVGVSSLSGSTSPFPDTAKPKKTTKKNKKSKFHKSKYQPPDRLDDPSLSPSHSSSLNDDRVVTGNATGTAILLDPDLQANASGSHTNWREKLDGTDESEYTRLRLFEDEESEEVHMRTKYLFDEDKAMTPLSQMQATKTLLTEGQRIAYVGLCALVAREMVLDMGRGLVTGKKAGLFTRGGTSAGTKDGMGKLKEAEVVMAGKMWMTKVMARLYQHMDLEAEEQRMIDSLAEHGVNSMDLVPALMTTHTIKNPEYDPLEARRQEVIAEEREEEEEEEKKMLEEKQKEQAKEQEKLKAENAKSQNRARVRSGTLLSTSKKPINPFGDDEDEEDSSGDIAGSTAPPPYALSPSLREMGPRRTSSNTVSPSLTSPVEETEGDITALASHLEDTDLLEPNINGQEPKLNRGPTRPSEHDDTSYVREATGMPEESKALPGVSTTLSKTEENITLDIRWTILCDLFLQLIADSVYDSRSRVFLQRVAGKMGLTWLDVTRFEKRVTDALEIQEGVERLEQGEIIEDRRQRGKKRRYAMMGLATLGGGLVIGLSAGLLAPVIGAGLGAAMATVGITGTTGFLAGAGGAAVITTGGVITGSTIGGKGMARRTKNVRTFEFRPIHNNKRVNCFIAVPGFMSSTVDDVRLPFSTLDPIVGDVFSTLWEPEMMNEMGNALKILTTEVLTSVGTTVLQATAMTALMSALQWPLILTKLGYLIDNPWSNALDRSYAAGLVLADTLINRHAGVRPISLVGFSLGARVIFYALEELAKRKAYGIVDEVYLFGATVTASKQTWLQVRSVVAGKFVNAFASSDWLLGYLFRATSGGLNTVAGLRPVENVPGLENVDVTEKITGHMSYRSAMPSLLEQVGLPITADWFDEPDDPELDMSIQERIIITQEEEEEARKKKNKVWGIFPRSKKSNSGRSTPTTQLPPSFESDKKGSAEYVDDDETTRRSGLSPGEPESPRSTGSSLDLPKTAGFDFKAISKVLGKDVDPEHVRLKMPPPYKPAEESIQSAPPPIERTQSAPPSNPVAESPETEKELVVDWPTPERAFQYRDDSTLSDPAPAPPARPFPSHVLAAAASIVNASPSPYDTPSSVRSPYRNDYDEPEEDADGDISAAFGVKRNDSLSMENPW